MTRKKPEDDKLKAELASAVTALLEERDLDAEAAADLLGMTEAKLDDLLQGRVAAFTERRLLECLVRLGQDVHIVVNGKPMDRDEGQISVLVIRPPRRSPPRASETPAPRYLASGRTLPFCGTVLRAQPRDPKRPPMSKEEAQMLLLHMAPTDQRH